jgi:O-antigen/teichoic acid export membrane protein
MKALISAIISKASGSIFTLALVVYLGHAIGSQDSGYFYFTLAVSVMLSQLLRLGLDGVVLRQSSRFLHTGDSGALQTFAGDVLVYLVSCGAALVLVGKAVEHYAAPLIFSGESPYLFYDIALYSFVPFTLMWTGASLLKGVEQTSLSVFIEAGVIPVIVLLLMLVKPEPAGYQQAAYEQAVTALLWANMIAAVLTLGLVFRFAGCRIRLPGLLLRCGELLAESLRGVWVAISNTLIVWSPLLILGIFATPSDVAVYNAAFRVTMVIGAFSPVFRSVSTPRLAALLRRNESPVPFLKKSMAHVIGGGLLVLLAGELAFDWVFANFGQGFSSAAGLATLMLVGMLANVLFVIMETQLILADRNDLLRTNTIFTVLVTLPVTVMLIHFFQAYGAALAFVITNVLSRASMLYLFNRLYGCRI